MDNDEAVTALYPHTAEIGSLVQLLRDAGVHDAQISIMSPLPLSERASARMAIVPFYVITIIAGLIGIGVGIFFAGGTAAMYPLRTGGKPIVAAPIVGIISYETMMLLAIVVTFLATVVTIRRSHHAAGGRDARIDDGYIQVRVSLSSDTARVMAVRALLQQAGPLELHDSGRPPTEEPGGEQRGHAVAVMLAAICAMSGCSRDMQEQPSYQPQESPRLHSPIGAVPRESRTLSAARPEEERVSEGATLFRINCSHCHGTAGKGDGPVAPFLKETPPNLHTPEVQTLSEPALYEIVTNGKDVMPPFKGELSADERRSVAAYVKSMPR